MIRKITMIEITQPVGTFYVGKINSDILVKITKTVRRKGDEGIQRELSDRRAKEISKYCEDPDATFPTPIILAIKEADVISVNKEKGNTDIINIEYNDEKRFAEILDGQHRIEGIKLNSDKIFEMMIVVMFDITEEEKAYIFSTINSNQTKVDKSLIYDLFELSEERSPQKTCHDIARVLNADSNSAFYQRLKMLGKKGSKNSVLSQGTFVNYLSKLISNKPQQDLIDIKNGIRPAENEKLVLRHYFLEDKDEIILKLLNNYFNAVSEVFEKEWNKPDEYILSKTTGYGALIKAFPKYYDKGVKRKNLSEKFFFEEFIKVKNKMKEEKIELTSSSIPSGEQGQKQLSDIFISCL